MPKKVSKLRRAKRRAVGAVSSVLSAPSRAKSSVRGLLADNRRGRLLHKQGVRGISGLAKARRGKTKK